MLVRFLPAVVVLGSLPGYPTPTRASSFEVGVSPSRFEISGKSGGRVGQALTVFNLGSTPTDVAIRTLDWTFSEDGNIGYHDELLPSSCRPWVTLERRSLRVPAQGKASFRFQIDPPADAPRGECRFMLAVEGVEPAHQALIESGGASLSLPVSGRIAVVVYLTVNGAEPKLEVQQVGMKDINGKRTPVVTVRNTGDAHGRLEGGLQSVDAKGVAFDLLPDNSPILPGQTRTLTLAPGPGSGAQNNTPPPEPTWPVTSKGQLDWEKGSFKMNVEFK
ncbi:MAG TPA: hypothetical protein VEY92_00085 [Pseudoxanthomonas sp.]|nr:hypothetical protein [Pseudoxanthomonas sp.]